jgi:hypothetical protein
VPSFSDNFTQYESDKDFRVNVGDDRCLELIRDCPSYREAHCWSNFDDDELCDHIHEACKTPKPPSASNEDVPDVPKMEALPPVEGQPNNTSIAAIVSI